MSSHVVASGPAVARLGGRIHGLESSSLDPPSTSKRSVRVSNAGGQDGKTPVRLIPNSCVSSGSQVARNALRCGVSPASDQQQQQSDHSLYRLRPCCTSAAPGSSSRSSTARSAAVQERSYTGAQNGALLSAVVPAQDKEVVPAQAREEEVEDTLMLTGKLVDGGMVYREKFVIRCYEVGVNRTASIESIANLMQEIGCNHAQSVGFSNDGFATTPLMRQKRLIWVTTRMHIEMDRYPVWGDVVELATWFQGEGSIVSRRDWVIKMARTGEVIGRGTSTWVMMNQDTRRLAKIPEDVQAEYMRHCPRPPRFAFAHEPSRKIPKLEDPVHVVSYLRPRRNDLDMNKHVNNVTYIGWMLESVPSEVLAVAELATITLEYRREVGEGEVVESLASPEAVESKTDEPVLVPANSTPAAPENGAAAAAARSAPSVTLMTENETQQFVHLLRLQEDGKEVNRGRTVWREKNYCMLNK